MSWQVELDVTDAGAEIVSVSGAQYLPKGKIRLAGHVPSEGTSQYGSVGVTIVDEKGLTVGHASAGYKVD